MWVSKRFDVTWSDLAASLLHCARSGDGAAAAAEVEYLWSGRGEALACLSVRSAFDLYLEARRLPAGSEVILSAMTVADMPRIARRHGLVPVPCDLDPETAAPTPATLEAAWSPATRLVVLAHLFGSRMRVDELVALAHERGVEVVEDCAEAYAGPDTRVIPTRTSRCSASDRSSTPRRSEEPSPGSATGVCARRCAGSRTDGADSRLRPARRQVRGPARPPPTASRTRGSCS
jgi:hypothetical protein